jgi:hypothetical protein
MPDAIFSVTPIRGKRRPAKKLTPQSQMHGVVDETQHAYVTNNNRCTFAETSRSVVTQAFGP